MPRHGTGPHERIVVGNWIIEQILVPVRIIVVRVVLPGGRVGVSGRRAPTRCLGVWLLCAQRDLEVAASHPVIEQDQCAETGHALGAPLVTALIEIVRLVAATETSVEAIIAGDIGSHRLRIPVAKPRRTPRLNWSEYGVLMLLLIRSTSLADALAGNVAKPAGVK